MNEDRKVSTLVGVILGASLVLSAMIVAMTFYRVRAMDNVLTVTGSTKRRITSDTVKWTGSTARTTVNKNLKETNAALKVDYDAVIAFFKARGFDTDAILISPILLEPIYGQNGISEYTLRQTFTVNSTDVAKITLLSKESANLINEGIFFTTQSLEYLYSKLPDLRIELLTGAIQDAKTRAETIAASSSARLGRLKSASAGVVQVLPLNSTDVSDYGAYDTSTIEKEVTGTVRAAFTLR